MGLMKIFSGEEKLAVELHKKIEEIGVAATLKNNSQINKSAKSTQSKFLFKKQILIKCIRLLKILE